MQTTEKDKEREVLDIALVNRFVPFPQMDSESLTPVHVDEVDVKDDDPDEIFFNAVAAIDTQPLVTKRTPGTDSLLDVVQVFLCVSLLVGCFIGLVWQAINYPKTTVTIFPVTHAVTITTALDVPLRTLAPVTVTRTASAPTTGHGHQDARAAVGILTFYNGQSNPQTIAIGTVFTGSDGVKVSTDSTVIVPAANLPAIGSITVSAHALLPGSQGNIAAFAMNVALSSDLKVKNETPFHDGRDARDYQSVAQRDLDSLAATTLQTVNQEIPHAFPLRTGEALQTTTCTTQTTADHALAQEAQMVTVKAVKTCAAVAYNQGELTQQATAAFTTGARPAPSYQLLGSVQTNIITITPFQVKATGTWVYTITPAYEQDLAERIAGDTPAQARAYLLKTGVISRATVPSTLPQAMYIQFLVLISL